MFYHLDETVLLSTQNICKKLWVNRKYLQFYAENFGLSKPMIYTSILHSTLQRRGLMVQMSGLNITFQRLDSVKWMLYVSAAILNLVEMIYVLIF